MSGVGTSVEIFLHICVVMGVILGLGIVCLFAGMVCFIQHPGRHKVYLVHMGWVVSILLTLVHFWWWEFWLFNIEHWTFALYGFLLGYLTVLYLLSTLIFPDDITEYRDYEDYSCRGGNGSSASWPPRSCSTSSTPSSRGRSISSGTAT